VTSPLRILLLEDEANDADLVRELLEANHFNCETTRVQTRDEFIAALDRGDIDLIFSDYALPSFDGLSALKLVLSARPDLPFIFVSGALGEEEAIEALKVGATDYVLKTRLSRLVPAVQRALGEARERAERKRAEERLRVQHAVAHILAEAATIEEVTPRILRAMAECLGWDVGALWRVDRDAEALRCVELWHGASIEVPEFERVSREFAFVPGLGLPGRVWSSLEPEYIPDVVPDENFPRGPIAEREGLHAAFGFPILLGGEVLGVIEFFSREIRQPDQELLNMLASIGSQIGQFVERKRAEVELRESEQNYRMLFESIDEGFCTIEVLFDQNEKPVDYRFLQINPSFGRQTGIKNAAGRRMREIAPQHEEHWFEIYGRIALTGEPIRFENEAKQLARWFDVYAFRVEEKRRRVGILFNNITERKRADEERERLRQLEAHIAHIDRVSMMRELAASMAHEITQPIASARNNALAAQNFLEMQVPDLGEVREALACVVSDADRARDIIDRIREHMKKAPPRKARFDLNEAIDEVIVLARSAIIKNGVSVETRFIDGLFPIQGDRVQLQQVILNLILNAVEAMSSVEAGARELSIITEQDHTGVLVDAIPGRASIRRIWSAFSRHSTPRSPAAWGWGCRYAGQSSKLTADDCG
jgi:PAS domain S-box-containing protein